MTSWFHGGALASRRAQRDVGVTLGGGRGRDRETERQRGREVEAEGLQG